MFEFINEKAKIFVYDVEVLPNATYCLFYNVRTKEYIDFDHTQFAELRKFLNDPLKILVGFNSQRYDDPMMMLVHTNRAQTAEQLRKHSDRLFAVKRGQKLRQEVPDLYELMYKVKKPWSGCFDVQQVIATQQMVGLKEYQCRVGAKTVADSPIPLTRPLDFDKGEFEMIKKYCRSDVDATIALVEHPSVQHEFKIRHKVYQDFKADCYASSRANTGSTLFKQLWEASTGQRTWDLKTMPPRDVNLGEHIILPMIKFESEHLKVFLEKMKATTITVDDFKNKRVRHVIQTGGEKAYGNRGAVQIGGLFLTVGLGGIHSIEEAGVFTNKDRKLINWDFSSFYPYLIVLFMMEPRHLQGTFANNIKKLLDRRMAAKKEGRSDDADVWKIVINAIFGMLRFPYSFWYCEETFMKVTINGQLVMMMLAEQLNKVSTLLSMNTDGILVHIDDDQIPAAREICKKFMDDTGFQLDEDHFDLYAREHCNSYIARYSEGKKKGKPKLKGDFARDLSKKAEAFIIPQAVVNFFIDNKPIEQTIAECKDIREFLYYFRSKKEGVVLKQGDKVLDPTVRWYTSTAPFPPIHGQGKLRGDDKANSQNAKVCNVLNDFSIPDDLDLKAYVGRARKIVDNVYNKDPKVLNEEELDEVYRLFKLGGKSVAELSKKYEVSIKYIESILNTHLDDRPRDIVLIDSNQLVHRAFHVDAELATDQEHSNTLYNFLKIVFDIVKIFEGRSIGFVWDNKGSILERKKKYPEYKAQRKQTKIKTRKPYLQALLGENYTMKDVLAKIYEQADIIKEMLTRLGFQCIDAEGFEGDDLIAKIVQDNPQQAVTIVSTDKDYYQLLSVRVDCYDMGKGDDKGFYNEPMFRRDYGITPDRWAECKAISGDRSDNIEGCKGVADKTAVKFLKGTLNPSTKAFTTIQESTDLINRNLELVTLPYPGTPSTPIRHHFRFELRKFEALCEKFGFSDLREQSPIWNRILNSPTLVSLPEEEIDEEVLAMIMEMEDEEQGDNTGVHTG